MPDMRVIQIATTCRACSRGFSSRLFSSLLPSCLIILGLALSAQGSRPAHATTAAEATDPIAQAASKIESQVILWRRDIHQHPELGFQEHRTAALVANHLRNLQFDEVLTGIGETGVVGILRGKLPGPVVALRADMDALPVLEQTGLEFASTATANWQGQQVPVMHACGHDAHVAILMGAASVLSQRRDTLAGTVMFIFQPAEEGSDHGGGAEAMLADGLFDQHTPDAIFALHVVPAERGSLHYRSGPTAASADTFRVDMQGQGTHGAMPWGGSDSLSAAAQAVLGIQSIISRRIDITRAPAIISVGSFHAGNRHNIVPSNATLTGTIRTFDAEVRSRIHQLIEDVASGAASSYGVTATTTIERGYPVLVNDPSLGQKMLPTLQRLAGAQLHEADRMTGAEDFAFYAQQVPGMYIGLGAMPPGKLLFNHAPDFTIDESSLKVGVVVLSQLALDFLALPGQ
ncbi:MAG: amidohydrolase [Gammaproteobacteria bacterium]|nr:amidohydrolase [Gammaproteobacteria bacterium]